jgi:hypothetical protein
MKIKGPADYSGPPTPPEPDGVDKKTVSKFEREQAADVKVNKTPGKEQVAATDPFENCLRAIAKTSGPQGLRGEEAVHHIVDTVLQEIMGKEFMSKPDAARLKEAISPLISQDEQMMSKLNSILNRLGKP